MVGMVKIESVVQDLRYLLDQGYPRGSAVNFVSNHYRLPLRSRHMLDIPRETLEKKKGEW